MAGAALAALAALVDGGLLPQQPAPSQRRYEGRLYGVAARVSLDMDARRAHVHIAGLGIPVLDGVGWLDGAGESGSVVLEGGFAAKLARLRLRVDHARLDRRDDTVTVGITAPLLGAQTIVLRRAADA